MSEFHFLRPWWLLALLPLAGVVVLLLRQGRSSGAWQDHVDAALLPYVLAGTPSRASRAPALLAVLAGGLAVLALAGPAWERLPAPVFRSLSALVVVLDLSPAMDAGDLKPSRIERARFKIDDILRARKDGQSALVVYAGDAFTVTPLTDDAATIAAQLGALTPKLMPVQGSRADLGLDRATKLLSQAGLRSGDVLLVTAGDDLEGAEAAAARLRKAGFRLSVLGVGTVEGAPIPSGGGGFLKDERGGIRVPRLDRVALKELADAGGGVYRTLDPGFADLSTLLRFFEHRGDSGGEAGNTVKLEQWQEEGIWLLPLLLPLGALAFRRGWLGAWLLLVLVPVPRPAAALEWRDLWQTPNQRAEQELRAGNAEEAARRFEDLAWKAAAEYKAGRYDEAAKLLERQETAAGQYNRGNALARAGRLDAALKAYDRSLKLKPDDPDAVHNRKLVEEELKRQQQEKEKEKEENKQQGDDQGQQPQPSKAGQKGQENQKGQEKPPEQQSQGQEDEGEKQRPKEGEQNQSEDGKEQQPADASDSGEQKQQAGDSGEGRQEGEAAAPKEGSEDPSANAQPAQADEGQEGEKPGEQPAAVPGEPVEPDEKAGEEPRGSAARLSEESRQSEEQWLRRIPDDPAGLLRRKFFLQYKQRQQQQQSEQNPW
jgi:Ca-activated chloride channel family protein